MLAQPKPAQHETLVTPVQGATPVTFTPDYAGGMQPTASVVMGTVAAGCAVPALSIAC